MRIKIEYRDSTNVAAALVKAGMKAAAKGYDEFRFGKTPDVLIFSVKKRCPRCGGNKYILGVVGPGTGPQNRDIGSIPCPECNKKAKSK
jgi:hypothetical protein